MKPARNYLEWGVYIMQMLNLSVNWQYKDPWFHGVIILGSASATWSLIYGRRSSWQRFRREAIERLRGKRDHDFIADLKAALAAIEKNQ